MSDTDGNQLPGSQSGPAPDAAPTERLSRPEFDERANADNAQAPGPSSDDSATVMIPVVEPTAPAAPSTRPPWLKIAAAAGGAVALLGIGYAVDLAVSAGKVPRGVTVAGIEIGGSSQAEAEEILRARIGPRVDEPTQVQAGDAASEVVPATAGIDVDWAATLDRAHSQPLNPFTRLASFFVNNEVGVASTVDEEALAQAMDDLRPQTDHASSEGNVIFEGATPVAVSPKSGQNLDSDGAAQAFTEKWAFEQVVELPVDSLPVTVTQEAVDRAMAEFAVPASSVDLVVTGHEGKAATLPRDRIGTVLSFAPDGNGGLEPRYNVDAAIGALAPQLVETEIAPKDASIILDAGAPTVVPGVVGDLVLWPKTLETLPDLLRRDGPHTIPAVYGPVRPALTTEDAQALGIKEVIGEFTTGGFSDASGVNIRLAASEINGARIKAGDTFSLNGHTGTRGTAQGYVESGIINHGRPDKAVGGGVSQVATTLYNAAYFAGMEDVDHTEHSYYISRYPEAREATVFEGAIDLQFRNPAKTGAMIQAIGTDSELTIRIWGTKTVDVDSITGERTKPTQPSTVTLPAGDHCVASSGAPGFTASDTRVITDHGSGQELSRNTRTVKYDPVPIVKCETPGEPKPSAAPEPSAAPSASPEPTPSATPEPTAAPAPTATAEPRPKREPAAKRQPTVTTEPTETEPTEDPDE